MASADRPERLRVRGWSIGAFLGLFGLTLVLLRMVAAAGRVIGWMLVAVAVAGLLHPLVDWLAARGVKRGRAVLLIAAGAIVILGMVGYRVVDDVQRGTKRLQEAVPAAAARIEDSRSVGATARSIHLTARSQQFVHDLPSRLRGGTAADALRAAATRGVAFLTTSVLTMFLLIHGPRIAAAAARQIRDDARRERVSHVAVTAYERAFGYARGTLLMAVLAGGVAYAAAYAVGVPGAAPLALWVGLWDVVPIVGAFIGAAPIVALATVDDPSRGIALALVFLAYQLFEDLVIEPRVEARTMRLGPFLTVAAGFAGVELRGVAGAFLAVLLVAFAAAVLDEIAPHEHQAR